MKIDAEYLLRKYYLMKTFHLSPTDIDNMSYADADAILYVDTLMKEKEARAIKRWRDR